MKSENNSNGIPSQLILVQSEPAGSFTAQVVGLPELQATASSRDAAIQEVRDRLNEWLKSGQLIAVSVTQPNPVMNWFGRANPNDPDEQAYLAELNRLRQEDLEKTLQEPECSSSSSTPTI